MGSDHAGHRARMLAKLEQFGPEIFEEHELLEMLLFFSRPRVNTNVLAHRLIYRFGGLSGVLRASVAELSQVEGIGPHSACLIATTGAMLSRYGKSRKSKGEIFDSIDKLGKYFCDLFYAEENEKLYAMYLDMQGRQIVTLNIATGDISKLDVIPAIVINNAIKYKSSNVVLAHNHPYGSSPASAQDINSTMKLRYALSSAGVTLIEHFSIGENEYYPILEENKFNL